MLAYVCNVEVIVVSKPTSPEIAEIGYFDLDDLPKDTDPGTMRRMREVVADDVPPANW